jgi:hypothetical protein
MVKRTFGERVVLEAEDEFLIAHGYTQANDAIHYLSALRFRAGRALISFSRWLALESRSKS